MIETDKLPTRAREEKRSVLKGNDFAAFFTGGGVASFCFTTYIMVRAGITNFESATNFGATAKLMHFVILFGLSFVVGFLFCTVVTIIPFLAAFALARRLKIENIWFFILGGGLAGILAAPLMAAIPNLGINETVVQPYSEKIAAIAPTFGICGLMAGATAAYVLKHTHRGG